MNDNTCGMNVSIRSVRRVTVVIFQIYFGVPRCTVKIFVVTSSVRGEVCGRHQKHAPLTEVRLIVEFFFLSVPPLHHTRAVTVSYMMFTVVNVLVVAPYFFRLSR